MTRMKENEEWLIKNGFSPSENDHGLSIHMKQFNDGHFTVVLATDQSYIDFYPNDPHLRVFSVSGEQHVKVLFNELIEKINKTMYALRNTKMEICEYC